MKIYGKNGSFIILLAIFMRFCGKTEGAAVTCELEYGFLPCTSGVWGRLFLIVVYQYVMSIGQSYISKGSNKFFSLIGPGIFGASLFHILANFPTIFIVLESQLSSDDTGASTSAAMGMSVLAGSAVMSLTLIWPSVIAVGSYDLAHDDYKLSEEEPSFPNVGSYDLAHDDANAKQLSEEEPSFLSKLTVYGVTTDSETSYTARLMLVSMIPFLILQLPKIINSASVTRVIVLIALIMTLSFFIASCVYQIFQPWIQNRRYDDVRQNFVKNTLLKLLSVNGKARKQRIKLLYKKLDRNNDGKVTRAEAKTFLWGIQMQEDGELSEDLIDDIINKLDITGDGTIDENEFEYVLQKWLHASRKSLSKNDNNPLSFFTKHQANGDEEQENFIPKKTNVDDQSSIWDYLEAFALVLVGIVMTVLIAQSFVTNVVYFANHVNIPSFLIPYFVIPGAINIPSLYSKIKSASQKTQRAASLTLSGIYSGLFTSSMSSLSTFLLTVYIKDIPWGVAAEVLVVLVIGVVMGIFTSTRTVFPLWTAFVGYLLYPIALLMLYLLTVVWGWA